MCSYFKIVYIKCEENLNEAVYSIEVCLRAYFLQKYHGEKFWTARAVNIQTWENLK